MLKAQLNLAGDPAKFREIDGRWLQIRLQGFKTLQLQPQL